ncbi:MAG: polysaccharide biosynthesis protein [Thermodesulfobacteriota bacterium]|nr:polysaccharide biosynthesis protein [Thermodesulfobacteriota bacterium]
MIFKDKKILITGGTGSLGKKLVSRILTGELGIPSKVIIFSRDEDKQHQMRLEWKQKLAATDEIIYRHAEEILEFQIGDIRDFHSVQSVVKNTDIIINAAALKQVPTCEYFPYEAVRTNIKGAYNIVTAVANNDFKVDTIVGVSTDKACKPVNVMGMTKSIQERILIEGNLKYPKTRFICVRYGNVLASRGSVIPLFLDQIRMGGPVTITTPDMTRFLMSLDKAVDTIFATIREAKQGETFIPRVPSAKIIDIANVMIGNREIEIKNMGIRPGEKVHEVLISEEECCRTIDRGNYFAIQPILPELRSSEENTNCLNKEYTSKDDLMTKEEIRELLGKHNLLIED